MILMIEKAWPFVYNQRMGICLEELMIAKIKCAECGEEFIPGKPWSKYCGYSCQQQFHRRKYHIIKEWWKQAQREGREQQIEERQSA